MRLLTPVGVLVAAMLLVGTSAALGDDYSENFDGSGWNSVQFFSASTQTNADWVVADGAVMDPPYWTPAHSGTRSAALNSLSSGGGAPYIRTPLLTGGVGTLTLYTKSIGAQPQAYKIQTSTNGTTWIDVATVTNTSTTAWTQDEVVIDAREPVYVRMLKTEDDGGANRRFGIDTISLTLPPSYVEITDVELTPSAPFVTQPTAVDTTITPYDGATNLSAAVYYSTNGGSSFASIAMIAGVSNLYQTTYPGIPAQTIPGLVVDYYIQVDFDGQVSNNRTNWWPESAPGVATNYTVDWGTSFTFSDTNWNSFALHNGLVYQGDAWLNVIGQGSGTPDVVSQSPYVNGVGTITIQTRNNLSTNPITFDVQISTNGTTWDIAAASFTNTSLGLTEHEMDIDFYESAYVRLVKTGDSGAPYHHLVVDTFAVTEPSSYVVVTNITLDPAPPVTGSNTLVTVTIQPEAGANNIQARLHYSGTSSTPPFSDYVDMELIGPDSYRTVDGIPAFDHPGQRIYYYIYTSFLGINPKTPSTDPETGAHSFLLGAAPPESVYTNMTIQGSLSTNMFLTTDYTWRGVVDPNGTLGAPSSFYYQSGASTWGDSDQSTTTTPIYGDPEASQTVGITEDISNYLIFTFTDGPSASNQIYSVAEGAYVNFNEWTGAGSIGFHTNPDGWWCNGARVSGTDSNDVARAFDGEFLVIQYGSGLRYLRTPEMTNGVGSISFWYRSWYEDGAEPSSFLIEKSPNGSSWTTVETVTNILTADWVYHQAIMGDPSTRYVRIQLIDDTSDSWLCFDEVAATEPGAYVTFSNPQVDPASPILGDEVTVSIDVTPNGGATNETCMLYYRSGTTAPFTVTTTTQASATFSGMIPPTPAGTVQYYFVCTYEGFEAAPAYYPTGGASAPAEFTVSGDLPSDRIQNFDSGWTTQDFYPPPSTQTNDGWVVKDCSVMNNMYWTDAYSEPHACWLDDLVDDDGEIGNPWIKSPVVSNGIGSISFVSHGRKAGFSQTYYIEIKPTGETEWQWLGSLYDNGVLSWSTNSLYVNTYQDGEIRIFKADDESENAQYLGIDDIRITYPPSDVAVSNVYFEPAYPAQNQDVTVYCDIEQINPNYPAFGFDPVIHHRTGVGGWSTSPMGLVSGNTYSGAIPAYGAGTVEYYVRCDFDGVYYQDAFINESRSPAFSPETAHTESEPATFHSYSVRYYRSDYDNVSITGNFETVEGVMIGNDWWEGAFYTDSTNQIIIGLNGVGFLENSQATPTNTTWGDSAQWLAEIPTAGTLDEGGSNIVANGSFEGLYLVRFDLRTGDYMILRADWQDFDTWPMHATLFTEGSQGRQAQSWRQTFNDWDPSVDEDESTQFENNWTNESYRVYGEWGEELFVVKNGRIVNSTDHRADLSPTPFTGIIRPSLAADLPGSGSMTFNYRVRDESTHRTTYEFGDNWTNYTVIANLKGEGNNTDDGSYWSVIYRYQNALNYYEMRVIATNQTQLVMEIVKHSGGTESRVNISTPFAGSLQNAAAIKVWVRTEGDLKVDHRGYYNNSKKVEYFNENAGINGPGTIGFAAYDVNMLVNSVSVSPYAYSESFTSTPTGWTVGSAWVHSQDHYRRVGRYGGDEIRFGVYTCDESQVNDSHAVWTQHQIFSNVTTLGYVAATVDTQIPDETPLTIIKHLNGNGSLRFDNVTVTSWRGEDAVYGAGDDAWIMKDGFISATTPHDLRNLEMRASRGLYTTDYNQSLRSARLETVGPVTFVYRTPAGSPAPEIELRFAPEGTPTLFSTITNVTLSVSEDWAHFSYPLNVESNGFVEIAHVSSDLDTRLFLDDVTFFDYHESSTNAWIAYNSLLTGGEEDKLYLVEGQSGYLNYDDDTDTLYGRVFTNAPYIQTPHMADGVGEISFWYRRWPIGGGLPHGLLVVEKSADASTWENVATIEVTSDDYTYYSLNQYDKNSHFVRFRNDFSEGVPDRVCLDNILVASPIATSLTITNAWTVPEVPVYTNTVKIRAALSDYVLSPSNVEVRAYYHIGTNEWATWDEDINDSLAMILIEEDTNATPPVFIYESANSIAAQPIDTVVQYAVRADFGGIINAEASSPQRFTDQFVNPAEYEPIDYNDSYGGSSNRNPYYVAFSCPTGSVWINDLNVLRLSYEWGVEEYVEICGRALTDLGNWRIRIVDTTYAEKGNYLIPGGTSLGSETNGFGFWVLGDNVPVVSPDMTFTNTPGNYGMHLPAAGGIELLRTMGARAHAISYETSFGQFGGAAMTNAGYQFVGQDLFGNNSSVAKEGTGGTEGQFAWDTTGNGYTPGSINPFQTLVGNDVAIATSILLTDVWNDTTNTWIIFTASPSDRTLTSSEAWYSTDLLSPGWTQISGGGYDGSGGTYTQWFNVMTNVPIFYKIDAQDDQ